MAQLRMWNTLIWTHEETAKVGIYPTFSRDPPPSKQILQGCNISTATHSTPLQHNLRIFIQFLQSYQSNWLTDSSLNFTFKSHFTLHEYKLFTSYNKDVIQQQFLLSECITTARDSICSQAYSSILFTLLPL